MSSIPDYIYDPVRLATLDAYSILDTAPESGFDGIVQLAMQICEAPVALISFVTKDRQWFKTGSGLGSRETDLSSSICVHALVEPDLLVVPDLSADVRTAANPLVTGEPFIRFYAGVPLKAKNGHAIGSLCVIDFEPRPLGLAPVEAAGLRNLARQVMSQLELRKLLAEQSALLAAEEEADLRRAGLLILVDQLRDVSTSAEMTLAGAEIVGRTLGAIRAGFGLLSADGDFVHVEADWTLPGMPSVAGLHRFADYGQLADDLRAGRPLIIEDVMTDPRTAASPNALLALNVRALVNVVVGKHGRPAAVLFAHFDTPSAWPPEVMSFLHNVADRVETGVARLRAEAQQQVLNNELSHRMKNTLAMVLAIAGQTLKGVTERSAVDAFIGRLHALASAHDMLLKQSWAAADFGEVVRNVTSAIQPANRFEISGPSLPLAPRATLSLSLLVHELTTNAVKYGALSAPGGSILIRWIVDQPADEVLLSWRERGGPPANPPTRRGFGSRLIGLGLVGTGGSDLRYIETGVEGDFRASLQEIQAT